MTPPTDAALISHLESLQRTIALARLGRSPSRNAAQQALAILEDVSSQLRWRGGLENVDLRQARAALVPLTLGHLPQEQACILAMRELLFVIFALSDEDTA
ncbi:MAG: hypothetical protein ACP5QB_12360 [Thiomonas sp.]